MGASYLNPYPIMNADFCLTVGKNESMPADALPDCEIIDFDALLMGGCFCHHCLRNLSPCQNGGVCHNYQLQGYTCECPAGYEGDHCQYELADGPPAITNLTLWPYTHFIAPPPPPSSPPPPPSSSGVYVDSGYLPMFIFLLVAACFNLPFLARSMRDVLTPLRFHYAPAAPSALLTTAFAQLAWVLPCCVQCALQTFGGNGPWSAATSRLGCNVMGFCASTPVSALNLPLEPAA